MKGGTMALPANVDTGLVTGRFVVGVIDGPDPDNEPDAIPATGTITFTASVPYLPNPSASTTILKAPIVAVLDSEGWLCVRKPDGTAGARGVRLIATDDEDLSVTGWTWTVTYAFENVNGTRPQIASHSMALPTGATVDLTSVVKVPSSTGVGVAQAEALAASAQAAAVAASQAALEASQAAQATDVGVASFIGPGLATATTSALDQSYRRGFSVTEYGAVGDGVTDDTAAIQAACAAAEAASTGTITAQVFIPAGIYRITDTITFITNVDAAQATFWYYGTGTAIQVGHTSPGALTDRDIHLPRVICRSAPAGTWDGTSVGVKILSTNQCRIHIPRVETFEIGVLITANGAAGTAYCEFYLGSLWINHENLVLDQGYAPSVGWINQNNFYGGRITHSVNRGIPDDPVACHLRIGNRNNFPADNIPDGNAFYGLSMEGVNDGPGGWARYRIFCFGKYNQFFNCRFEARDGGVPVIRSEGLASNNIIHGGYHSWRLVQSGLNAFDIRDGTPGRLDAVSTTGQVLASGENVTVTGWTTSALSKVTHNAATGEFTPTPGRWRIRARITYVQNATGTRTTRLYRGGTVIDQAVLGAQSTNSALTTVVESTAAFNGAESFKVSAQQNSGAPLALTGTAPYVSIQADYLGH